MNMPYLKLLAFMLFASSISAAQLDSVLTNIIPGTITFIGESHHRIESPLLIKRLIHSAVGRQKCQILALEIGSDQQPVIDQVMADEKPVGAIEISETIDHEPFRTVIAYFAKLKSNGYCLDVVAIDAGADTQVERNEWMAARLAGLPKDKPIIVLVGALHTLKKVAWTVSTGKPSVAEILAGKGFRVKSFPQRWIPGECPGNSIRQHRFVGASDPEAATILNESLLSLLNAKPAISAEGVVDGFIVWGCDSPPRGDSSHSGVGEVRSNLCNSIVDAISLRNRTFQS
ncbi:hypothetical protein [Methylotuvimicrobium sp. KM1]|uniref:hypothetical protein n=1 Tax=Methylotuvimicrobium sp. KM1 TaxID=3377707 RepID=UPI00384CE11A